MAGNWRGRRVAVVGLGVENIPLARFLIRHGARVTGLDQREAAALAAEARALADMGVRLITGESYLEALVREPFDYVFLTPGMIKDRPEIRAARRNGAQIDTQTNLFLSLCRAPVIGVTGTSGKSTTTTLIGQMLTADGRRPVFVGGNLGKPLVEQVEDIPPEAWVVLELSSFQLELTTRSPHIAVLLNLFPNHLDVHGSMAAYAEAKQRILRFQRAGCGDVAVLNFDDPYVREMAAAAPGRVTFFGCAGDLPEGTAVVDGWIVIRRETRVTPVLPVREIPLPGAHNVVNVLAAVNVADLCGVPPTVMRRVIEQFRGLEHRLERVAEINGVLFVNDSIATTPDRTVAALGAFSRPIVLIAGGYDKGIPFRELADAILAASLRCVVLTGRTAPAIAAEIQRRADEAGQQAPPIINIAGFDDAFQEAVRQARPGDVVLLSPACASYDMFPNFMARGERFRALVRQLGASVDGSSASSHLPSTPTVAGAPGHGSGK